MMFLPLFYFLLTFHFSFKNYDHKGIIGLSICFQRIYFISIDDMLWCKIFGNRGEAGEIEKINVAIESKCPIGKNGLGFFRFLLLLNLSKRFHLTLLNKFHWHWIHISIEDTCNESYKYDNNDDDEISRWLNVINLDCKNWKNCFAQWKQSENIHFQINLALF